MLGVAIGFALGARLVEHYDKFIMLSLESDKAMQQCDVTRRALDLLQTGNTNALGFLETELDNGIIDLGDVLAKEKPSNWSQANIITLQLVKDYKRRFPWTPESAEMGREVTNVLALIDGKN